MRSAILFGELQATRRRSEMCSSSKWMEDVDCSSVKGAASRMYAEPAAEIKAMMKSLREERRAEEAASRVAEKKRS